jgi:hypothetical protein
VYYFSKDFPSSGILPEGLPETQAQLPDLVYEGFVWDDDSKRDWLDASHDERMYLLAARGNAIDPSSVCMPISLFYEKDSFETLKFCPGMASVVMTYNDQHEVYLGFVDSLANKCDWVAVTPAEINHGVRDR